MVDPARHTGLPERTLGELSETSLGKKYLIQTRTKEGPKSTVATQVAKLGWWVSLGGISPPFKCILRHYGRFKIFLF